MTAPNIKTDDRLAGGGDFPVAMNYCVTDGQSVPLYTAEQMREYAAALRQRCEQAEADARRYRFLADPQSIDPYGTHWCDAYNAVGDGRKKKEQIDEDVDTAIRVAALAHDAQQEGKDG